MFFSFSMNKSELYYLLQVSLSLALWTVNTTVQFINDSERESFSTDQHVA